MGVETEIVTDDAEPIDTPDDAAATEPQPRDYEAEARAHGWTPKDAFKGDPTRWVDAETFARRADEFMPFLQKQNKALKREIDDVKRSARKAAAQIATAEERAYTRAMADLERKLADASELGDSRAATALAKEMRELPRPEAVEPEEAAPDPAKARKEIDAWMADNDWYVLDDKKRAFADLQAQVMGPATEWEGGQKAWLAELGHRVSKRFAEPKPNPANPSGNRSAPKGGGKTFADLPPEARAIAEKWDKQGVMTKEQYVKSYQFD